MAVLACRCLNVVLRAASAPELQREAPPTGAFRHHPLRQNLGSVIDCTVTCQEKSFLGEELIDTWRVFRCLFCQTYTHVISTQSHKTLVNMALITTRDVISKLTMGERFSPMFKVLIDEIQNTSDSNCLTSSLSLNVGNLNENMKMRLRIKLEDIENEIRLFREQKFSEFEEYSKKAQLDYKEISSALLHSDEAQVPSCDIKDVLMRESAPTLITKRPLPHITSMTEAKPKRSSLKNAINIRSIKDDPLDSEDVFSLEGMDSLESPNDGHNSDAYESDTDDSVSRDEGIHIARDSNTWRSSIAKSLPVNVPEFTHFHDHSQDRLDRDAEKTRDIAASIEALARSVHGDVFGELPRPRFSTQI